MKKKPESLIEVDMMMRKERERKQKAFMREGFKSIDSKIKEGQFTTDRKIINQLPDMDSINNQKEAIEGFCAFVDKRNKELEDKNEKCSNNRN